MIGVHGEADARADRPAHRRHAREVLLQVALGRIRMRAPRLVRHVDRSDHVRFVRAELVETAVRAGGLEVEELDAIFARFGRARSLRDQYASQTALGALTVIVPLGGVLLCIGLFALGL